MSYSIQEIREAVRVLEAIDHDDFATDAELTAAIADYLPLAGGDMSGAIDMNGQSVTGVKYFYAQEAGSDDDIFFRRANGDLLFGYDESDDSFRVFSAVDKLRVPDSLIFESDTNTGVKRTGSDTFAFHAGGTDRYYVTTTQTGSLASISNPWASGFPANAHTAMSRSGILAATRDGSTTCYFGRADATSGWIVAWYRNGSVVGSVSVAAGSTSYNTSSDERLKENIRDHGSDKALREVIDLKVRDFDWKIDGSRGQPGLIAQEVLEVIPDAVSIGEPDELDPDQEDLMMIDYGRLTPYLIGAIQEQQKTIESLTARITALEGSKR